MSPIKVGVALKPTERTPTGRGAPTGSSADFLVPKTRATTHLKALGALITMGTSPAGISPGKWAKKAKQPREGARGRDPDFWNRRFKSYPVMGLTRCEKLDTQRVPPLHLFGGEGGPKI